MERVYTDYTASGRQIVLNNVPTSFANITVENIRLIFNETQKNAKGKAIDPLVSTGVKENLSSITYDGTAHTVTIILSNNVPEIVSTDDLTIKIDMGDSIDSVNSDISTMTGTLTSMYNLIERNRDEYLEMFPAIAELFYRQPVYMEFDGDEWWFKNVYSIVVSQNGSYELLCIWKNEENATVYTRVTDTAAGRPVYSTAGHSLQVLGMATSVSYVHTNDEIYAALSQIQTEDPNSKALVEFFGVTLLQGYEFMQDTEVTDELEDIMQALDPELTAAQAASITAQAMQIINPSQS